jgi:hypothetical protein
MRTLFAIVILVTLSSTHSSAQGRGIVGAYESCPFHCVTIQIKADRTFVYRLDGDLYNDQRIEGTWSYVALNKIHATSVTVPTPPLVEEDTLPSETKFQVKVLDSNGAPIQPATVKPVGLAGDSAVQTNDDGVAVIPRCGEFEVTAMDYRGTYRPKDPTSNSFQIVLTPDQMTPDTLDEVWVIRGSKLQVLNKDGTINRDMPFTKISRSRERAIFR